MANSVTGQVATVNATGAVFAADKSVKISGITIAPTNATWALTLTDGAGKTVLALNNNSPAPVLNPKSFTGLTCSVATAVAAYIWIN